MAIGVFELIGLLPLACCKQCLHLLFWVECKRAARGSSTAGPSGAGFTVTHGKFHLDERFACILHRCPARTDPPLWAGHHLCFPVDGEVSEIIARLGLIPVGFERRTEQIHLIVRS